MTHLAIGIRNDWKGQLAVLSFVDVFNPFAVRIKSVAGETDNLGVRAIQIDLDVALGPFRSKASSSTQFSGTDRSKVFWMREQNGPRVLLPSIKVDFSLRLTKRITLSGWSGKVWSKGAEAKVGHLCYFEQKQFWRHLYKL